MPRLAIPLSDLQCRTAKTRERAYKLFDGGGMYLFVKPNGVKTWRLKYTKPNGNLVRAYYQETIKDSWVEKLPGKSMRWTIFTGLGLGIDALGAGGLGTAAGVTVGAIDTFLADKLVGGWKPHQFVERDLKSLFDPTGKGK